MKHLIIKIQFTLFTLLLFTGVNADTVNFSADTAGQPVWQRTLSDCATLSGTGSAVNYHTQTFSISSNDSCTLTADRVTHPDTYLHLYTNPFNPNNQAVNCVAANDDGGVGLDSEITSEPLVAGQTYIMVTSAFASGQAGTFDGSISCPTATVALTAAVVNSIPTLSTWSLLLLLLTLFGVGTFVRKSYK
jgi:hypothetical protein